MNLPALMAWANDFSYDEIFVGPLRSLMRPGDVVVAISGSGNSRNVLRAVEWANAHGGMTVGLCGYGGGRLKEISSLVVHAAVDDMQVAEDLHLAVGHMVAQALCGGVALACLAPPMPGASG
jgi:D-sedoheptulose 7-phosphate isomerase